MAIRPAIGMVSLLLGDRGRYLGCDLRRKISSTLIGTFVGGATGFFVMAVVIESFHSKDLLPFAVGIGSGIVIGSVLGILLRRFLLNTTDASDEVAHHRRKSDKE